MSIPLANVSESSIVLLGNEIILTEKATLKREKIHYLYIEANHTSALTLKYELDSDS